ncbi:hypothetical protein AZH53_10145 [Methanomicrobiaceae archaeon CYW5]|uniref:MoaD/ThiS family protein n=1 Tax=Methanovulcanius yangii TaxID=1789227 RepID=UPI0029CA2BC2|nr:MoaD/ThiS family protein [Methanovulcanius yangii]MBT8508765.1 hypothetical protein [Methanovulcanius yangii]
MNITIRAFARFREDFGERNELTVEEAATLPAALRELVARKGHADTLFEEDGGIKDFVLVMVGGRRLTPEERAECVLAEGDEVVIYPPVSGG